MERCRGHGRRLMVVDETVEQISEGQVADKRPAPEEAHRLLHDRVADIEPRLMRLEDAWRQAEAQESAQRSGLVVMVVREERVAGAQHGQNNRPSCQAEFDGTDLLPHRFDESVKTHRGIDPIQYLVAGKRGREIPFLTLANFGERY